MRYHSDAQYRQNALDRSKKQKAQQQKPSDGKTITFGAAAEALGVTTVTLRSWKKKDYFPEPTHHGRHLVFSEEQLNLLKLLTAEFARWGWNMRSPEAKQSLDSVVSLIYCNWE